MIDKIIEELEKLWSEYNSHNDYRDYKADAIKQAIEIVKKYDNDGWVGVDKSVDIGYLYDWYIHSVNDEDNPVWTEEHLNELCGDFILIPQPYKGE